MRLFRRLFTPVAIGTRRFPSIGSAVLGAVGASLLLILATTEWRHLNDEYAYWLAGARLAAGQPLYDPAALPNTPYAYWYPPPLAQLLAPITSFVSADAFAGAWTALLLACLWWIGGRDVVTALALIAFLPVAVELRVRNVHLILAVFSVLALRRSSLFWIAAAAIKITPVLGGVYLVASGRWREALRVGLVGGAVLAVSVALAPDAWRSFLNVVAGRAGTDEGSLVAIPFAVRLAAGVALAVIGGRVAWLAGQRGSSPRSGEAILIVALTIANPTLWATAFSILVAIVPLWRTAPRRSAAASVTVPFPLVEPEVSRT